MSETDHVHERGEPLTTSMLVQECLHCGFRQNGQRWTLWEAAIADVSLHGLPDHRKRLASVVAIAAAKSLLKEEWMTVEEVIDAYLTWTKEEES